MKTLRLAAAGLSLVALAGATGCSATPSASTTPVSVTFTSAAKAPSATTTSATPTATAAATTGTVKEGPAPTGPLKPFDTKTFADIKLPDKLGGRLATMRDDRPTQKGVPYANPDTSDPKVLQVIVGKSTMSADQRVKSLKDAKTYLDGTIACGHPTATGPLVCYGSLKDAYLMVSGFQMTADEIVPAIEELKKTW